MWFGKNYIKEYLTEVRSRSAIDEMRYSNKGCIQIAVNSGFSDQKGFDIALKKKFGISPNQYRKELVSKAGR
ncbi:helix-turn-helix domain-containing protein [Caproiciproducens sp. R2]|uniref:helix-turn-helix domain-containing protein n=1 Tax=Caproiciproducens sp. R2 TaxID=3435187 RepID=UPI0040347EFA